MNFSSDISFIIECCKTDKDDTKVKELIANIDDWDEFIDLAYVHGIFPLVYHTLKVHTNIVPQSTLQTMKSENMNIAKQNMLMTAELIKVMKLLEENNIDAIAFKGPLLSQMAYGDVTLRQYVDLDILIDLKQLSDAALLLTHYGYTHNSPLSLLQDTTFQRLDNDFSFFTPKNNIHIELHWRLFRKKIGKHQNFQDYFSKKSHVGINAENIATLSIEHLLVYICIHGSKHAWERIEWINDINLLIISEHSNINWDTVINIANEMNSKISLLSSLNLIHTFYNTKLPDNIMEITNTEYLNNLTKEAFYFIQKPMAKQENYNHYRKIMLFQIKLLDSRFKQIKYILNSYFSITRNDYLAFPLPSYLSFLYYIIKPFRVIYKVLVKGK